MCAGAVLSAKSQSDKELQSARSEARNIIHAFHKCKEKLSTVEVSKEGKGERKDVHWFGWQYHNTVHVLHVLRICDAKFSTRQKKVSGSYSELL